MHSLVLMFALVPAVLSSVDYTRLSRYPAPAPNFQLNQYLGEWFTHAMLPPCSWKATRQFTDFVSTYIVQPPHGLQIRLGWRSVGVCTRVTALLKEVAPGAFVLKDTYGDVVTGDNIVVDTDHVTYAVKWGCTQKDVYNTCSDPFVLVKTRARYPLPETIERVNKILYHRFGLNLANMIVYRHDKVCYPFGKRRKHIPIGKH